MMTGSPRLLPLATFLCAALLGTTLLSPALRAADLSGDYSWKPVRLGAGGFVTGLVIHPLDPDVRYCRTDVGNAYRWDAAAREWMPLVVREGLAGVPVSVASAPSKIGVESIAVDPLNPKIVLISFPAKYSSSDKKSVTPIAGAVFRSTDGGINFTQSDLNVKMMPNGGWRHKGECMGIDPVNPGIVYYGSRENGLWRSADGGLKWSQLTTGGAPDAKANVIGIRFDRTSRTAVTTYAIVAGGTVLRSADSGTTWTDVGATSGLEGKLGNSFVDQLGNLYVVKNGTKMMWKMTREGAWSEMRPDFGSSGNNANGVAVDPANPRRLFAIGTGGSISRSLDGGVTWVRLGNRFTFGNTFAWLPQIVKGSAEGWRSNGGILFDQKGRLWVPQGNEGVLSVVPSTDDSETAAAPLRWQIDSKGIEEFVSHDIIIPPGGGDRMIGAVEDGTAFLIKNPDTFDVVQANLQPQLISNGTGLAFCPNAGNYVAVTTADVHHTSSGKDFSGYSTNGGQTWTQFASQPEGAKAGSIAISRRDGWGEGADHLVWYPLGNRPPYWSHDGGKTWTQSAGFPLKANGTFDQNLSGFWNGALKQRALMADPHVADRFFLYTIWGGASRLFRSDDGGRNWIPMPESGLPAGGHHAQLAANPFVKNDHWFADGWESGGPSGLWHSTDGATYAKLPGIERAITLALGKGPGAIGAVFFYGKLTDDPEWGVFRSVDGGATWDRISRYPAGQIDIPTSMAASHETFGLVAIGLSGNSFVYGRAAK